MGHFIIEWLVENGIKLPLPADSRVMTEVKYKEGLKIFLSETELRNRPFRN